MNSEQTRERGLATLTPRPTVRRAAAAVHRPRPGDPASAFFTVLRPGKPGRLAEVSLTEDPPGSPAERAALNFYISGRPDNP